MIHDGFGYRELDLGDPWEDGISTEVTMRRLIDIHIRSRSDFDSYEDRLMHRIQATLQEA